MLACVSTVAYLFPPASVSNKLQRENPSTLLPRMNEARTQHKCRANQLDQKSLGAASKRSVNKREALYGPLFVSLGLTRPATPTRSNYFLCRSTQTRLLATYQPPPPTLLVFSGPKSVGERNDKKSWPTPHRKRKLLRIRHIYIRFIVLSLPVPKRTREEQEQYLDKTKRHARRERCAFSTRKRSHQKTPEYVTLAEFLFFYLCCCGAKRRFPEESTNPVNTKKEIKKDKQHSHAAAAATSTAYYGYDGRLKALPIIQSCLPPHDETLYTIHQ